MIPHEEFNSLPLGRERFYHLYQVFGRYCSKTSFEAVLFMICHKWQFYMCF